jgi:hypothetical protein
VVAAHAPVQADLAQGAPRTRRGLQVDAEILEEAAPFRGDLDSGAAIAQELVAQQAIENAYPQFPGEVVVADAGAPQRRLARPRPHANGAGAVGDAHQRLQQLRDVGSGKLEVAVPPLLLHGDEARIDQLRKVGARGLLGNAGFAGELGRGQRLARDQRREDVGARPLAHQRGDASDVRAVFHGSIVAEPS